MASGLDRLIRSAMGAYWAHTTDMTYAKDVKGVYVAASQAFAEMAGYHSPDEVVGKTDYEVFADQELAKRYVDDDARLYARDTPLERYVEPMTAVDGQPRYCLTSKYILRDDTGKIVGILGMARDITREFTARQSYENEMQSLLELPPDALVAVLFDVTSWRIVDSRFRENGERVISRYVTMDEYIRNAASSVYDDEAIRAFFAGLNQQSLRKLHEDGHKDIVKEYQRKFASGDVRWVRSELHFLTDPVSGSLSVISILLDIDATHRAYDELVHAAERDPMTGLFHRSAMITQIEIFLRSEGTTGTHALFMIDLDNFKQMNDTFGHQFGDRILRDSADAIRSVFRATDLVARMGGDEFMALMKNVGSEADARNKAAALISALQFTARSEHTEQELTCSVGLTVFEGGRRSFPELYDQADTAMYLSKTSGKNRYSVFGEPVSTGSVDPLQNKVDTVHLRTLMEYMDGGVILSEVTDDIRITYVSPSFFKTFNRTEDEVGHEGVDIMSVVHPDDLPGLRAALFLAAKSGDLMDYTYRVTTRDGVKWRHIRAKCIPEREDGVPRIVSVVTDISSHKHTEEHLREMETRYRTAVEQTDLMLWEMDLVTRTLTLSGSAWEKLGYGQSVFENAPDSFLAVSRFHRDSMPDMRRMFSDMLSGNDASSY